MTLEFPIKPMLATAARQIPNGDDWAFEIKWDGYRALAFVDADKLRMQSRSGLDMTNEWTALTPGLADLPASVNAADAVLDGELVAIDSSGVPNFVALQRGEGDILFQIFDVLQIGGQPTIGLPYQDRRSLLTQLVESGVGHRVVESHRGDGTDLLHATEQGGLEGVVAKQLSAPYVIGQRSRSWLKFKHRRRLGVMIGGYTLGEGARAHTFGSLLVGVPEDGSLRFVGRVGTGFNDEVAQSLAVHLVNTETDTCPFDPHPPLPRHRTVRWVTPTLGAIVEMAEQTSDGVIRHGSFVELVRSESS